MTPTTQPRETRPFTRDDFCVIAAIDNDIIFDACLARSPDVVEGGLQVIEVRNAKTMATAYNQALEKTDARIALLAHQDVYLPRDWLDRAVEALNQLTDDHPEWMVCGPYGVKPNGEHLGRVWDTILGMEFCAKDFAPEEIGSLDELLIILRRETGLRFDEKLPHFHLYGTDIVQMAKAAGGSAFAIELPVIHNNRPIASLGGGYMDAYRYTRRKWRHRLPIWTTVSAISYFPVSLWRAQWRRRKIKDRGAYLHGDVIEIARQLGYE